MSVKKVQTYYPRSKQHWRRWLQRNHIRKDAVWVIFYKKKTNKPSIVWSDAVDEALCFGWIDSVIKTLDHERSIQFFSKRKPTSTWSKINKEKVKKLIETGKMTSAGMNCIEKAQKNGSWNLLDQVEELIIPQDLEEAFIENKGSKNYFLSLNKTTKKGILQWITLARQPQTRQKRILEIAKLAAQHEKPKQFR